MEIGFDKEIDALLRKARDSGAAVAGASEAHIDADSIAAFAEDALPAAARLTYIKHFADCHRCRRILANVASAKAEVAAVEPVPVVAPIVEKAAPWYSSLFGRGGLVVAFGSLLILFGVAIVVLIIQRSQQSDSATVAQTTEDYQTAPAASAQSGNSAASSPPPEVNSNIAANSVIPGPNLPAANAVSASNGLPLDKPLSTPATRPDGIVGGVAPVEDRMSDKDRYADSEPKPEAVAPPPAPPGAAVTTDSTVARERKGGEAEKRDESDDARTAKRSLPDLSAGRDMPAPTGKSGPLRSSGPVQSQNMQTNKPGEMSVNRKVGGRSFTYRDSVWYDSAYGGQATVNFTRGSEDFKKLDGGLRSIANTLGGTAVIMWKGKAYRIR